MNNIAFLSSFGEFIGAVIGLIILLSFLKNGSFCHLLTFAAGIMVYVSIDEHLSMVNRYGHSHTILIGIVFSMITMAISLIVI